MQGPQWWVSPAAPFRTPEGFPVGTNTNDLSQKEVRKLAQQSGARKRFLRVSMCPVGCSILAQMEPGPTQQVFPGTSPLATLKSSPKKEHK